MASSYVTHQAPMNTATRWMILAGAVGAVVIAAVTVGFGAELGAGVIVLSVAAGALVLSLRRLFLVVTSLGRGEAEALAMGRATGQGETSSAQRQEQRRVLKAIKELEFDHAMGKLSDADHESISTRYKLRAVELMRATEGEGGLHPSTQQALRGPSPSRQDTADAVADAPGERPPEGGLETAPAVLVQLPVDGGSTPLTVVGAPELAPTTAPDATVQVCGTCEVANDLDARIGTTFRRVEADGWKPSSGGLTV